MATRERRIQVWEETQTAVRVPSIASRVAPSEKLIPADMPAVFPARMCVHTDVAIEDVDCLDAALRMQSTGLRPVVLTLADDEEAGGGVGRGSGAQEESLWRRTALCATQLQTMYPLERAVIYSPAVPVLRRSERDDFAWLDPPMMMSFLACAGLRMPMRTPEGDPANRAKGCRQTAGLPARLSDCAVTGGSRSSDFTDLCDSDTEELTERLRLILRVAAMKGHDAVVLGAMGCGAWRNPPRSVARVFARVLPEFDGVFKEICIAILTTDRSTGSVLRVFQDVFDETFS
jgi:hypothetical protein